MVSQISNVVRISGSRCGQGHFEDAVRGMVAGGALALHGVQEVVKCVHVLIFGALQQRGGGTPGPGSPFPRFGQRLRAQQSASTVAKVVIVHGIQDRTRQRRGITAPPYLNGRSYERCAPRMAWRMRVSVRAPGILPVAYQLRPGRHVLRQPVNAYMGQGISDPRVYARARARSASDRLKMRGKEIRQACSRTLRASRCDCQPPSLRPASLARRRASSAARMVATITR